MIIALNLLFLSPLSFCFYKCLAIHAFKKFNIDIKVKMVFFQIIQNVPTVKSTLIPEPGIRLN